MNWLRNTVLWILSLDCACGIVTGQLLRDSRPEPRSPSLVVTIQPAPR